MPSSTGAATGIGKAIATAMITEGATVVVDYVGEPTLANGVIQGIQAAAGRALAILADVSTLAR